MPIARRIKVALAATTLILGCQAAPPSMRPITALAPELVAGAPRSTQLRMMLREKDVREVLERRYGLQQFQQIDWDMVRVWLSNSRAGFVTRMEKASPTLDLTTNTRAASLLFDNLTPGGNYSVVLYLYRNGDQNQFDTAEASDAIHVPPELIASGTNTDFTIRSGQNNINVVVRLIENGGELTVDVEDPATPAIQTIAAQFSLTTYSHFLNDATFGDIDAETGGEIGGIAALMDGSGDMIFTVAGSHQIRKYDGGTATSTTLLAGTGTQTNASYTTAGDYAGSLDATLNGPRGLVVGQNGEMLFADAGNARIRALRQDNDASGSLYRIETLIGSGPIALSETGASTEPIDVALVRPVGIVADDNGTVFFADDDATNSQINIYRYEMSATDNAIATLTFIDQLTRTNSTASSFFGTMAINRLRDLLWVVTGDNEVRAITGIYGTPSDAVVANFSGSEWFPSTSTIRAIAFDQLEGRVNNDPTSSNTRWGTLYLAADDGTASGDIIYRVPVQSDGTLPTGRVVEPIAGGDVGASATAIDANHARALNFNIGWNAMTFNLDQNNDGGGNPLIQLFVGDVNGDLYKLSQFLVDTNNNWVTQAATGIFYPTPDPSPN